MFTGLIAEIGTIIAARETPDGKRLRIRAPRTVSAMKPGDSISVNGVCLTAESLPDAESFEAVAVGETLRRTTLGGLRAGSRVHLESALRLGDRLGGHWVNGHVDATAAILSVRRRGNDLSCEIELAKDLAPYVVEKGSIAVDGISLTVGEVSHGRFAVHIIPATLERTLVADYRPGVRVNLEIDILAKYAERLLGARAERSRGIPAVRTMDEGGLDEA